MSCSDSDSDNFISSQGNSVLQPTYPLRVKVKSALTHNVYYMMVKKYNKIK